MAEDLGGGFPSTRLLVPHSCCPTAFPGALVETGPLWLRSGSPWDAPARSPRRRLCPSNHLPDPLPSPGLVDVLFTSSATREPVSARQRLLSSSSPRGAVLCSQPLHPCVTLPLQPSFVLLTLPILFYPGRSYHAANFCDLCNRLGFPCSTRFSMYRGGGSGGW